MANFFTIALLTLVGLFQYQLWFSPGGVKNVQETNRMIKKQETELVQIQKQNSKLVFEIADLKHKEEEIENSARSKLGMIKQDEVFYQVLE